MQKVETKYHYITTNANNKPKYTCSGLCKKVYWEDDYRGASVLKILKCQSCDGNLISTNKADYTVLEYKITSQKIKKITVSYMSEVKPEFIEYAKKNWVS